MKLLHMCFDGNFIEHSYSIFEHFYPNNNIWFIEKPYKYKRVVNLDQNNVSWVDPLYDKSYLTDIPNVCINENIDAIVIHGLAKYYLDVLEIVSKRKHYKVYWLFWGFELYRALGQSGKMSLTDGDSVFNPMSYFRPTKYSRFLFETIRRLPGVEDKLMNLLNYADYFCFWLYEDYLLLQKFYPNSIQFKYFQYTAHWKSEATEKTISERLFQKSHHTIMINHQASSTGNHVTVMKKLRSFSGIDKYEIVVPVSYGSGMNRRNIIWTGRRFFKKRLHPIREYLPLEEYNNLIGKMEVAIFGQLRQEAAGNIYFLLENGTKIFMRENNVLYQHLKKEGYFVYSFENDLNSTNDLVGLSREEQIHNAEIVNNHFVCYEDFMPTLFDE